MWVNCFNLYEIWDYSRQANWQDLLVAPCELDYCGHYRPEEVSVDKWTLAQLVWGSSKSSLLHWGRRARVRRSQEGRHGSGFMQKQHSHSRAEQVQWQSPRQPWVMIARTAHSDKAGPRSSWEVWVRFQSRGAWPGTGMAATAQARTKSLVCLCLNAAPRWSQKDPASYSSCSHSTMWQLASNTASQTLMKEG